MPNPSLPTRPAGLIAAALATTVPSAPYRKYGASGRFTTTRRSAGFRPDRARPSGFGSSVVISG